MYQNCEPMIQFTLEVCFQVKNPKKVSHFKVKINVGINLKINQMYFTHASRNIRDTTLSFIILIQNLLNASSFRIASFDFLPGK